MKPADLARLNALKERMASEARENTAQREAQAQAAARERIERDRFRLTVGAVTPQPQGERAHPPQATVPPEPRQRQQNEAQALASSLSDELDVSTLLDTDAALSYRREGVGPDVLARLRRGQWSIQRQLDLHGLRRDGARDALAAFIRQAERDGLRCVRVIHGKGNGSPGRAPVLKDKVKRWLVQKNQVIAFTQASAADGGHGALLVLLRG
ncbi:MAG: Smr/MutS family protein [Burkholderiaceae bacterium]|nr:Smr/MutS family protein [Burkholderiaceae bacterium]